MFFGLSNMIDLHNDGAHRVLPLVMLASVTTARKAKTNKPTTMR
ncbi:MAG: hypothetical protein OQK35_00235 [Alphaproteobacteria bacterium]|nr:hypothetical protein [Rhodospirillales bacterium]MCW9044737.1 hypothetical protein [Alphaproteobacteria bacterium]